MVTDNPPISIIIVSHDKPSLLPEAVESVLSQTFSDWQAVLIDSGVLHDRNYFADFPWSRDPRLRIVRSAETPALRRQKAMAPWCFNECFRRGWIQGELVMYLCDDDLLYPNAFATFVNAFQNNAGAMAMYASQDISWLSADGSGKIVGERRAIASGGKSCNGRIMDCQVDYLQLCHRRSALTFLQGPEYWPEDKATEDHADGLFMEKLGNLWEIFPIDIKVSQNRRTPWSINGANSFEKFASDPPVHETIMDEWAEVCNHLCQHVDKKGLDEPLAKFQIQLRKLCEQDHALRHRLISQRYRMADRLHTVLNMVPGTKGFSKYCRQLIQALVSF